MPKQSKRESRNFLGEEDQSQVMGHPFRVHCLTFFCEKEVLDCWEKTSSALQFAFRAVNTAIDKRNAVIDQIARLKLDDKDTDPAKWPVWYNQPGKNKGKDRPGKWMLLTDTALEDKVKHFLPSFFVISLFCLTMQIKTCGYCQKYNKHKAKELIGSKVDWWVGIWLVE